MKKFLVLLKKEIRELLTPQMLIPFVVTVVLFFGIGKIVGKQVTKQNKEQKIVVLDLDNSVSSRKIPDILKTANIVTVSISNVSIEIAKQEAASRHIPTVVVLPLGFGGNVAENKTQHIPVYNTLTNFSFLGSKNLAVQSTALELINQYLSNEIVTKQLPGLNPQLIREPITPDNFVQVGTKQIQADPQSVLGFVSSQTTFIPIILFIVIVLASQMIAVSIASEKENKTLETLLSTPTNRKLIVASKLVGAGLVALGLAVIYMFGLSSYMSGVTGDASNAVKPVFEQLGLVLGLTDYILIGLSLFFGILAALSVAIILGSFAEDTKSAQGVITPIMVLVMIPYFLTLFLDFSTLPTLGRWAIYAIPFSHPFLASQNVFLKNYDQIIGGIVYEAVFFLIFVYLASKLFSSDKILTLKFSFRKRKNNA